MTPTKGSILSLENYRHNRANNIYYTNEGKKNYKENR